MFAIDNGAYSGFDRQGFQSLLERERTNRDKCLFVSVPDVVGSAVRTREVFEQTYAKGQLGHWPLAYVCQDGQGSVDIPWDRIAAIFIGGTNSFKTSSDAISCIRAAQILNKWVHVGRVNGPSRWAWCEKMGVDSIDGSGISRYSHMRQNILGNNQQDFWGER